MGKRTVESRATGTAPKEPLAMLTVRLRASLVKRLKLLAAATDKPIQTIVEEALEKRLDLPLDQDNPELRAMLNMLLDQEAKRRREQRRASKRRKGAK